MDKLQGDYNALIIDAIKAGKKIRFVGDNINFRVGVRDERSNKHGKMFHYFGSAVLIYGKMGTFDELPDSGPQEDHTMFRESDLLPSNNEVEALVADFAYMSMKVAITHIAYFSFLKDKVSTHLTDKYSTKLMEKTTIIPLTVLPKNEQKYGDVVDIMRHYEGILHNVFSKAGCELHPRVKIHIGGDQLTRERFSGAKRLLIGAPTPDGRLDHLTPITSEYFHMAMKLLGVAYKQLYNKDSGINLGTMKSAQTRIQRNSVDADVKNAYNADKDFFISFVDAYIVEAVCHHFDLLDTQSTPPVKVAPLEEDQQYDWAVHHFTEMVKSSVGLFIHRNNPGNYGRKFTNFLLN